MTAAAVPPGGEVVNWFGLLASAGMSQPVIDQLNAALRRSLDTPTTRPRLAGTPSAFAAFVSTETAKFGRIIEQARIKEE